MTSAQLKTRTKYNFQYFLKLATFRKGANINLEEDERKMYLKVLESILPKKIFIKFKKNDKCFKLKIKKKNVSLNKNNNHIGVHLS